MARRSKAVFTFRVTESEVVDPERVRLGLALWADYLAHHLPELYPAAPGPVEEPASPDAHRE